VGVVAAGMCSGTFGGAGGEYAAVATDVEVIACAVETALAVGGFQCLLRKGAVFARGAAMDDDQGDCTHGNEEIGVRNEE